VSVRTLVQELHQELPLVAAQTAQLQAGATTNSTLAAGASTINGFYVGWEIFFIGGGTGQGQSTTITAYDGATRVATFATVLGVATSAADNYLLVKPLVVRTLVVRPRLQGNMGALRAQGYNAVLADDANISINIRPDEYETLTYLRSVLTTRKFWVTGGAIGSANSAPYLTKDISGTVMLSNGDFDFALGSEGIVQIEITFTNFDTNDRSAFVTTQVFATARPRIIVDEEDYGEST
jgi:hypothetical protein